MVEIAASPAYQRTITVNVDDAVQVHRLTHQVALALSDEACMALREFLANVREHCARKEVEVITLPSLLVAYDHGGGLRDGITRKPDGEGGYGIRIMRAMGAELRAWDEGTMLVVFA